MRRRLRYPIILAAIVIVLALAIWMKPRRVAQPAYQGVSLSDWIKKLPEANQTGCGVGWYRMGDPDNSTPAAAIRKIGTNALPYLAQELKALDTPRDEFDVGWDWVHDAGQELKARIKNTEAQTSGRSEKTSGEMRHWRAAVAIHVLGTDAKPLLPRLDAMLNRSHNAQSCVAAAYALSGMGPDGIHSLVAALCKTNELWAKFCAIWALGQTPEAGCRVIPQLLPLLHDNDSTIRETAAWTLGQLNTNEEVIVPALSAQLVYKDSFTVQALKNYGFSPMTAAFVRQCLTNSKPYMRIAATNAYLAFDPKEAAQFGIFNPTNK